MSPRPPRDVALLVVPLAAACTAQPPPAAPEPAQPSVSAPALAPSQGSAPARATAPAPAASSAPAASAPSAFATAVQPVATSTVIHTDAEGLVAGDVSIRVKGGTLPGYRAAPTAPGKHPVVLLVQEIFGVHEYIEDVARRLAKLGYVAIAPELFHRQGDVSKLESIDDIRKIVATVPDAQVMSDLDACVAFAEKEGGDPARLAITGFCWGGRITWLYAAHQPKVKAGVAWYGRVVGDATPLQPKHPVDVAGRLKAPILGLYGGADTGIPLEAVERMRVALATGKTTSTIHVYPDAPHAFHADYRPSYRKGAAADGWNRLVEWLKKNGV